MGHRILPEKHSACYGDFFRYCMRSAFYITFTFLVFSATAQSALELTELLGKSPKEVDLTEYLGTNIDTVRSATWRYSSKPSGVLVQAHIDQYDPTVTVITTITLYFTKEGYENYKGDLPFGINPSKSWNRNRVNLYRKEGFADLLALTEIDVGRRLEFKAKMNDQNVFITALYLNNKKGVIKKEMYSLQFSILNWDQ